MRLVAALLFVLGVIAPASLLQAASAQADTQCATEIIDDAHLYKGDLTRVQQAVDALKSEGADVRVRTINGFAPYPSLDSYLTAERTRCKGNWSNDDGSLMKGNLVVLAISNSANKSQRALQLYYGSDWHAPLKDSGEALRIQSSVITPYLRNGDYVGGTVAGLKATGDAINAYLHPSHDNGSSASTHEAPDLSGLWTWLGWLLGVVVAGVLGFFGFRGLSARRNREAARQTARGEALRERDAASTIIADLHNPTRDAVRKAQVAALTASGGQYERQAQQLSQDYQREIDNAEVSMSRAATSYEGADNAKLTTEQYQSMKPVYAKALTQATKAKKADDQIKRLYQELQDKVAEVPSTIAALKTDISSLQTEVSGFVDKGYRDDGIGDSLGKLGEIVFSLEQASPTMQVVKAAGDARNEFTRLQSSYQELSSAALTCVNEVAKLPELVASARRMVPDAQAAFARVSATYAEDSWQSVAGNGTEAEKRFSAAESLIVPAEKAVSLESQKWDKAEQLLEQAHTLVGDGQSLLAAITEREAHLAQAKDSAQAEIDAAQRDIDKVTEYERTFDADIRDSLRDDVAQARELLEQSRQELAKPKPNYLRVVDLALQANRAADEAYAECASSHEAAERLRQQAVSSVQLAEASISKADRYIRNHSSDIDGGARKHLKRAGDLLASAKRTSEASDIVSLAGQALTEARSAYRKAEQDFTSAEAERERIREEERRRRQREEDERRRSSSSSTVIVGGYGGSSWGSSSSSSSWDSGSGSSSSFGGFGGSDGGSGSSSSW